MNGKQFDLLFKGWEKKAAATHGQINAFEAGTGLKLPPDYVELLLYANGISDGNNSGFDFRELEELVSATFGYEMAKSKLLYIGTDGGDEALALDYRWSPPRYVRYNFYGGSPIYMGATIEEMVHHLVNKTKPKKPKGGVKSKAKFIVLPTPPRAIRGKTSGLLYELKKNRETVRGLAVSPDGKCAVVCCYESVVRRWDLENGKLIDARTMPFPISRVIHFVDDATILSAAEQSTRAFHVGNLANGTTVSRTPVVQVGSRPVGGVFTPDGSRLFYSSPHGFSVYVDTRLGRLIAPMPTQANAPFACAFTHDGSRLLLGASSYVSPPGADSSVFEPMEKYNSGRVMAYDSDGNPLGTFYPAGRGTELVGVGIAGLDVAADGRILLHTTGELRVTEPWDGVTEVPAPQLRIDMRMKQVTAALFLGDGERFAFLTRTGTLYVYDTASGQELYAFNGIGGENDLLAANADGSIILTASDGNKIVRVWNIVG